MAEHFVMIGNLAGGIGLFLLGMRLLTDGLRLAAGLALRNILARSTRTTLRGVTSGALITALVQSSGAVTVATIGFVNASLMDLGQAITVIYGSNIGTTMTGWLVALAGLHLDIKTFALPMIGVGMVLRLLLGEGRWGGLCEALSGFGIFFLGIHVLKTTFEGLGEAIPFEAFGENGSAALAIFVGIGFLLTFLMQSSSAAVAITLTATAGGLISLTGAAAVVIGANVGSTSTAAFAVLGATPNAKRVASAHVAFNLLTGMMALLILPFLLALLTHLREVASLDEDPATLLALFHTTFNVLGVALLLPMTGPMVRFLNQRFRSAEEDEARPRYLDRNVVRTPVLAMHALAMELARVGAIAGRMAKAAISAEVAPGHRLAGDKMVLDQLVQAAGEFSNLVQRGHFPAELDEVLPNALRVSDYYRDVAETALAVAKLQSSSRPIENTELSHDIAAFKWAAVKLLDTTDVQAENYSAEACREEFKNLEAVYRGLKARLLRAGTKGELPVPQMVNHLDLISHIHRITDQAEKGARYLTDLNAAVPTERTEETHEDAASGEAGKR